MKFAADGDNSYLALSRHYDACLRRHGDTAQGADWPNEADRRTRFSVMLDILAGDDADRVDLLGAEPLHSTDTDYFFGKYYTDTQAQADFNAVWNNVKRDVNAAGYPTLYRSFTQAGWEPELLDDEPASERAPSSVGRGGRWFSSALGAPYATSLVPSW